MFAAGLEAFGELSPGADGMMPTATAFGFALAAAHRVVDWVHRHAAHMRTPSAPARATGFAAGHVHVIDIADLTNRCVTGLMNAPDLTGRHFYQTVTPFAVI